MNEGKIFEQGVEKSDEEIVIDQFNQFPQLIHETEIEIEQIEAEIERVDDGRLEEAIGNLKELRDQLKEWNEFVLEIDGELDTLELD